MDNKEDFVQYDITTAKGKHTVQYYYGDQESEYHIFLDGELIIFPKKYRIPFFGFEYKTIIDNEVIYFIFIDNEFRVIQHKRYIDNGGLHYSIRGFLILFVYFMTCFILMFYFGYRYEGTYYYLYSAILGMVGLIIYVVIGSWF